MLRRRYVRQFSDRAVLVSSTALRNALAIGFVMMVASLDARKVAMPGQVMLCLSNRESANRAPT